MSVLTVWMLSALSAAVATAASAALIRTDGEAANRGASAGQPSADSTQRDLAISAGVDRTTVEVGDQLILTLTIEGEFSKAELQPFQLPKALVVAAQSRSTNLSVQAGAVKRSMSLVYVLAAQEPGKVRLGPFQVTYQGKRVLTDPIDIVIHKPVLQPSLEPHERFTL